jgi:hypothetical protein
MAPSHRPLEPRSLAFVCRHRAAQAAPILSILPYRPDARRHGPASKSEKIPPTSNVLAKPHINSAEWLAPCIMLLLEALVVCDPPQALRDASATGEVHVDDTLFNWCCLDIRHVLAHEIASRGV